MIHTNFTLAEKRFKKKRERERSMKAETDSTPVSSYGVVSAGSPMFKVQTSKKGQIYMECDYWTQDQKTKGTSNKYKSGHINSRLLCKRYMYN